MLTAQAVLDQYFLDARCMLIELAATLDRYDRAAACGNGNGAGQPEPRIEQLHAAIRLLAADHKTADRSEQLLNLFSDPDE